MKNNRLLYTIFSVALLLNACSGDSSPSSEPTQTTTLQDKIIISATENTSPILSQKGGSSSLTFNASSSWTTTSSAGWCTISPSSGQTGINTITFTATENENYNDRVAIVTIKSGNASQTITISQVQKDAIVLALKEHEVSYNTTTLDFEVQTNVSLTVSISDDAKSWITQADTRILHNETLHFNLSKNEGSVERNGVITIKGGDIIQTVTVKQGFNFLVKERDILMDFYKATGGNKWTHNDNWGSEKPLNEWYGIHTDPNGHVTELLLESNNLNGTLPESLGNLTHMWQLWIPNNKLRGKIPTSFENYTNLVSLNMAYNQLSGSIPEELGKLTQMDYGLFLDNNQLTGSIPQSLGNLTKLKYLNLSYNKLTGAIPSEIGNLTLLEELYMNDNNLSGTIPVSIGNLTQLQRTNMGGNPKISGTIPGSITNLTKLVYLNLSYTSLTGVIPNEIGNLTLLEELWLNNSQLTGEIPNSMGNLTALKHLQLNDNNLTGSIPDSFMNLTNLEGFSIENNKMDGTLSKELLDSEWWKRMKEKFSFKQQDGYRLKYGWLYQSTDYSQDGKIAYLQQHTLGKGLKIVITGEAFSDRMIANGEFDEAAYWAMESFFNIEPYTTYRDYFDVYSVVAVSKNEIIDEDVVFETKNGKVGEAYDGTNHEKIAEYVKKIPALNNDLSNVTTILLLNNNNAYSRAYCLSYSDGFSIGYAEVGAEGTLQHESGGHGFGNLADEYSSDDATGNKKFIDKVGLKNNHKNGWELNVDTENNTSKVLWSDFIFNDDYAKENIGIYEGAMGSYSKGIYRSTPNSIMRDHYAEDGKFFNAPSRWAIYQKIMGRAGESYSFNDFLNYDKKNLQIIYNHVSTRNYVETDAPTTKRQLGAPPIFLDYPSSEIGIHK